MLPARSHSFDWPAVGSHATMGQFYFNLVVSPGALPSDFQRVLPWASPGSRLATTRGATRRWAEGDNRSRRTPRKPIELPCRVSDFSSRCHLLHIPTDPFLVGGSHARVLVRGIISRKIHFVCIFGLPYQQAPAGHVRNAGHRGVTALWPWLMGGSGAHGRPRPTWGGGPHLGEGGGVPRGFDPFPDSPPLPIQPGPGAGGTP
jgi:hypothetical protein